MKNVKNMMRSIILFAVMMIIGGTASAAIVEGRDYTVLSNPQPSSGKNIEVLEFFFYGCSHCYNLHPHLEKWKKEKSAGVEMKYVPTIFRSSMEPMARTFYALESIGKLELLNEPLYKAWNVNNMRLFEEEKIADFVVSQGVDRAKFLAAYNSFSMQSSVSRARQMTRSYMIQGTPTLVVAGKYAISGLQPADTVRVLSEVIELARKDKGR